MWILDGSKFTKSSKGSLLCCLGNKFLIRCTQPPPTDPNGDPTWVNCMWCEGSGINSGEHYWIIQFSQLEGPASVGLSNKARFKPGSQIRGLFYEGQLGLGDGTVSFDEDMEDIYNFGPPIGLESTQCTIGLLVSFRKTESYELINVFVYYNGRSLGPAFSINESELPDAYPENRKTGKAFPVVRFSGAGVAEIKKEKSVPLVRVRVPDPDEIKFEGIDGHWQVIHNSVTLEGESLSRDKFFGGIDTFLKFEVVSGSKYKVMLELLGRYFFEVDKTEKGWTSGGVLKDHAGKEQDWLNVSEDDDVGVYRKEIWELLKNPETVSIGREDEMIVVNLNGKNRVCFARVKWDADRNVPVPPPLSYTDGIF